MDANFGNLYIVATPIGNLEDMTFRALRVLREVDLIAAEDTRHSLKLLTHYGIKKLLISYHLHNEKERADEILTQLRQGRNVALISDAGMPGISDPGAWLVAQAISEGIRVTPIPGVSAVITALAACGLATDMFCFKGFLPRKKTEQLKLLQKYKELPDTLIFYESPRRVEKTLQNILECFGDRQAVLARELTKIHEQFLRGPLSQLITQLGSMDIKGEFTIVVAGARRDIENMHNSTNAETEILRLLSLIPKEGISLKDELRKIGKKTGKSTKEIYRFYLKNKK